MFRYQLHLVEVWCITFIIISIVSFRLRLILIGLLLRLGHLLILALVPVITSFIDLIRLNYFNGCLPPVHEQLLMVVKHLGHCFVFAHLLAHLPN